VMLFTIDMDEDEAAADDAPRSRCRTWKAAEVSRVTQICCWCGADIAPGMPHYRVETEVGDCFHHSYECRRPRQAPPSRWDEIADRANTAIAALVCLLGAAGVALLTCMLLGWRP